jgi:hypothetical protein
VNIFYNHYIFLPECRDASYPQKYTKYTPIPEKVSALTELHYLLRRQGSMWEVSDGFALVINLHYEYFLRTTE